MDRLALEGITFTDAYAASPTCSPSRAALITGKHPARLRLVRHIPRGDPYGRHENEYHQLKGDPARFASRNWLPLEHLTLAEALKPRQYRSAFVGKWHLGHEPYHPVHQGFDRQFGVSNYGHPKSYHAPFFGMHSEASKDVPKGTYLTDQLTDDAIRYIGVQDPNTPFLLTVFYYAAHTPYQGRADLVKKFEAQGLKGGALHQAAMVAAVDESLGRIRRALGEHGFASNTIICLVGDQGSLFSNAPLRGGKRGGTALYEGGARVPFVMHWPGRIQPGICSTEPVLTTDVLPTLLDCSGGAPANMPDLDGVSLVPLIEGAERLERGAIFLYRSYEDQYAAVRAGRWKMIAYRSGRRELYDLATDLSETRDLSQQRPDRVRALERHLDAWEKRTGVSGQITGARAK